VRVLFLCHRFPFPPDGGGKIRALHIVRHLLASGHDVTLASLVRTAAEAHGADVMRAEGVRVEAARVRNWKQSLRMLAWVPTARPSSFAYFYSPEFARRIERLLRDEAWDLIFVHCSSMAPYVSEIAHVPKILDFADMDSEKWLDYSRVKRFRRLWSMRSRAER
jgi:polysaccharide biosynthesis protein PslH